MDFPRPALMLIPSLHSRYRLAVYIAVTLLGVPSAAAQGTTRTPDIFLASLELSAGRVVVGAPRNLTRRDGYDNQPAFSGDGAALYFTSVRQDQQADIYRLGLATGALTRITVTSPESEYSAAELPGERAIAVIRVERDSTQRLWRLTLDSAGGTPLFPGLKPVGYHASADRRYVLMFVLGTPSQLVLGDRVSGRADTLLANVGRSLHRIPGTAQLSFVSKAYAEHWYIMALDPPTRDIRPIARLPRGVEDYAWLPDGRLIVGTGSQLLVADPRRDAAWEVVADLGDAGLDDITRLAVSPAGDRLAIVALPRQR